MMLFIRLTIVLFVSLFAHFQLRAQEADYVPNEFLVQFNPESSAINWFNSLALEKKATGFSAVKMLSEPLNIYQLNINPSLVSENEAFRFLFSVSVHFWFSMFSSFAKFPYKSRSLRGFSFYIYYHLFSVTVHSCFLMLSSFPSSPTKFACRSFSFRIYCHLFSV